MLDLALSQIYTRYFTCGSLSLWAMLGLEILAHLHLFSHWGGFARLAMRDTRVVGAGFPTSAYLTF